MWPSYYFGFPIYLTIFAEIELRERLNPRHQQRAKQHKAPVPKRHRTYNWH